MSKTARKPKRLFRKRRHADKPSAPLPLWDQLPEMPSDINAQDVWLAQALHSRIPGKERAQEEMRKIFLVHRYVFPNRDRIVQIAAHVLSPFVSQTGSPAEGVVIPSALLWKMPPMVGQQMFAVESPRKVPWFAEFDQQLSDVSLYAATTGTRPSTWIPGVSVLATDDDRVIGYTCACVSSRNCLLIRSCPGVIDAAQVMFCPELPVMKIPYVMVLWTAENYRRQGVASELISYIAKALGTTPDRMAYETPFSERGLRVVQKVAGLNFVASAPPFPAVVTRLDQEHRLAECHYRQVLETSEEMDRKIEEIQQLMGTPSVRSKGFS